MVHGIVTQHGGCITCDSRLNEGTVFRIYLPEAPGRPEPSGIA
jgi:signal transduction histidine kinase